MNGDWFCDTENVITSVWDLTPGSEIDLMVDDGCNEEHLTIHTKEESATLNVLEFGAVGDGSHDDTNALQAAIACCPENGRILIPKGIYSTCPLFLKSHIRVELSKDAVLQLRTDRNEFPILPGKVQTYDEEDDPDDIVKTLRLNKKYKFQIYIIPIGIGSCDLTYYICDNNDNPIDQYTVGYVGFLTLNHDIDEVATKGLTWLFGMYI